MLALCITCKSTQCNVPGCLHIARYDLVASLHVGIVLFCVPNLALPSDKRNFTTSSTDFNRGSAEKCARAHDGGQLMMLHVSHWPFHKDCCGGNVDYRIFTFIR